MDIRLQRALDRWGLKEPRPTAGDASARAYYRVKHPELGSAMVILHPLDEGDRKNDETYFEFQALHAYLDPLVRVPTILQSDDDDRVLVVEDIGDTTLEQRLMNHPGEELDWATRVGFILATNVGPLTQAAPQNCFFMNRSFDQLKFEVEWAYCRVNFFQDFLQKEPPRWLDRMMEEIHQSLESRAQFFVHRDFHVRNLMVQGDRLVVLDFQDARRGAATYDLASILFDAYWDWSPEAGEIMIQKLRQEVGWADDQLWEELNLSALQRNLKALGTFGFQLVHRRKARYASAIPRTLRHLRGHFQRLFHREGVLAAEQWLRIAEKRLMRSGDEGDGSTEGLLLK